MNAVATASSWPVSRLENLHPLLRSRFSPMAFNPAATMADDEETSLVEAARWVTAASA